eukprot:6206004-Pleurochrysis_carterae.AAC.1
MLVPSQLPLRVSLAHRAAAARAQWQTARFAGAEMILQIGIICYLELYKEASVVVAASRIVTILPFAHHVCYALSDST